MYYKELFMKNISPKALLCALLTSLLFFTTNVISAESNIKTNIEVMQQSVHLNKSTIDDLVTLKGIGQKKAQAIVAYRKQIGGFKSVSELIQVKGIGEKILSDNKDRLKI
ncbi:MAG: competence protein ComEA [Colwellia sp.]|jgi:competence protein ComEA|tara:strand:+ start:21594 stop:21923 length:330 start_codon:yes stop_codon:yes gene_type:complete